MDLKMRLRIRDRESLVLNFDLCRELTREGHRRGRPLPPAKYTRPKLIAARNKMKGGIDTYSAILAHCKVELSQLHPVSRFFLRGLMTLILNAHYVWRLLKLEEVVCTC